MSQSKVISVTTIIIFIFTIAMVNCALAGEKLKYHGTGFTTDWQQTEVGDVEGHILGIQKTTQVFIDEATGEKFVSTSISNLDINPKRRHFTVTGYASSTDKDGDKLNRINKGKAVGKGHWKGIYTYIEGTGKYKGVKGGGTWESWNLAPKVSYYEVEGERDIPKK